MAMHISLAKDMEPPTLQLLQARPKLLFSSFSAPFQLFRTLTYLFSGERVSSIHTSCKRNLPLSSSITLLSRSSTMLWSKSEA